MLDFASLGSLAHDELHPQKEQERVQLDCYIGPFQPNQWSWAIQAAFQQFQAREREMPSVSKIGWIDVWLDYEPEILIDVSRNLCFSKKRPPEKTSQKELCESPFDALPLSLLGSGLDAKELHQLHITVCISAMITRSTMITAHKTTAKITARTPQTSQTSPCSCYLTMPFLTLLLNGRSCLRTLVSRRSRSSWGSVCRIRLQPCWLVLDFNTWMLTCRNARLFASKKDRWSNMAWIVETWATRAQHGCIKN